MWSMCGFDGDHRGQLEFSQPIPEVKAMVVPNFRSSVVRICDESGETKGTGFFVTDSGHLLTSNHVICGVDEQQIRVQFGKKLFPVSVEERFEHPDIALLRIKDSPTPHCLLGEDFEPLDPILSHGFHRAAKKFPEGFPVTGRVSGETVYARTKDPNDFIAIERIDARKGLSGAPVFDDYTKRVIGILSFKDGEKDALAIPIRVVLQKLPQLKLLLPVEHTYLARFKNDVAKLYDLLGWRLLERNAPIFGGSDILDLLVEKKVRGIDKCLRLAVIIEYKDNEEPVDHHSAANFRILFGRAKEEHNVDYAHLVTNTNFDPYAKGSAAQDDRVRFLTYSQLLAEILDVEEYIESIIYDYENFGEYEDHQRSPVIDFMDRDNLYKYYVPLNAKEMTGSYRGSIEAFVALWLGDETRKHLSILGDFGTGKSSFCLRLTYEMAKKYRSDPLNSWIPLFIPLKDISHSDSMENTLITLLKDRYRISVQSFADFRKMLELGKLLLIFDGFDEMTTQLDRKRTTTNLELLNKLAIGQSKVILTCRTHYFTSQKEIVGALAPAHDTELMQLLRKRPQFTVLILEELREEQIKTYLQSRATTDWEWLLKKTSETYDLADLIRRPLLLKMVVTTATTLRKNSNPWAIDLYEAYSKEWIELSDWRSTMTPDEKSAFMRELAYLMYSQGERQEIHYTELAEPIQKHFKSKIFQKPTDAYDNDVRTCSFLNRDADGNYRFMHKSFMEFFVAQKLSTEIQRKEYKNFERQRINPQVASFLVQYLQKARIRPDDLWELVKICRGESFDSVQYRATNAMVLLRQIWQEGEFAGRDFAQLPLRRSDFANLNLKSASFRQTDLELATFNHSELSDADFRHAILRDVSLGENNAIYGMDFDPKHGTLAIAGSSGNISILNVSTPNLVKTLAGHENNVKAVAYSGDGKHLVSGGIDRTVRIWEAKTGQEVGRLHGHLQGVRAVAYCRRRPYLASGSYDSTARLWEIEIKLQAVKVREKHTLKGHEGPVYSLAFCPSRSELATGSTDGTIRVWDLESGTQLTRLEHSSPVDSITYSNDGKWLAGAVGDKGVQIWEYIADRYEKSQYFTLAGSLCFSLCFSLNERYLAAGDQSGRIIIWDLTSGRLFWQIDNAHYGVVNALRFLENDGFLLASGAEDGILKWWDMDTKNGDPIFASGIQEDLHVKGMKIGDVQGLSDARITFLKAKGAID